MSTSCPTQVWVLCGDSEMAEGSIWEAFDKAAYYHLSNLIVIIDVNRLGQRGPTELSWDLAAYTRRAEAFGARVLQVDGHDVADIDAALSDAGCADGAPPTVILARTEKGRGFSEVQDKENWHGKPLPPEMAERAILELGGERNLRVHGARPEPSGRPERPERGDAPVTMPAYEIGAKAATAARPMARRAGGPGRAARRDRDGWRGQQLHLRRPVRRGLPRAVFRDVHRRAADGRGGRRVQRPGACALRLDRSRPSLTRAHDFIRMAAISRASICLVGSHAGVEIGADGPSQMALEDLAMMRAVQGATVLYPSDATSTCALVAAMADRPGVKYMRTTRGAYPVLYAAREQSPVGGSRVLTGTAERPGHSHRRLKRHPAQLHRRRADLLSDEGIPARVIDLYSINPTDAATLTAAARETGFYFVLVEDHHPEGGLGEAVLETLALLRAQRRGRGAPGRHRHARLRDARGTARAECLLVCRRHRRRGTNPDQRPPAAAGGRGRHHGDVRSSRGGPDSAALAGVFGAPRTGRDRPCGRRDSGA